MKKIVIICVDDEKIVLNSLKTELKHAFGDEYILETAEGGKDALELYDELTADQNYDIPVVISDYVMPDMKGDELLISLHKRSDKSLKILLTGQATMEGVTNVINQGSLYRYIAKPWEPHDLVMTIKEAIRSFYQDKKLEQQNEELRIFNQTLEQKVKDRTAELAEKNKNIMDSIFYAKRIQQAVLPRNEHLNEVLGDYFILFKPRDVVSGDFFWGTIFKNYLIFAVADCTGHGVPGAFMSMLGIAFLNEIVNKQDIFDPAFILNNLRKNIISSLHQQGFIGEQKDGMDIAIVMLDLIPDPIWIENGTCKEVYHLVFSGANSPLWVIRKKVPNLEFRKESQPGIILKNETEDVQLFEILPDPMPIGIHERMDDFTNKKFLISKGDTLYIFSDGFADQFGGPKGKKFKYSKLRELILNVYEKPMNTQKEILEETIENWKGEESQIDDISILGVRI